MIEVRLFGPRDDQWAVISAKGKWLATTRAIYVVAVKNAIAAAAFKDALANAIAAQDAIADAIAKSNPSD